MPQTLTDLAHLPDYTQIGLIITFSALGPVLFAERTGWEWLNRIFKPICSAGFLLAAFAHTHVFESAYTLIIAIGLVFAAAGDVLLIPKNNGPWFKAGVLSFLLGHVAYLVAFLVRGVDPLPFVLAMAALLAPAVLVWRYLKARVEPHLTTAVFNYIAVITLMVALAAGTSFRDEPPVWEIIAAAFTFYVSDLTVARQRFVVKRVWHRIVGLPLYFGAQFLFILSF
jgi:uncharacterized membrane protein YhhN